MIRRFRGLSRFWQLGLSTFLVAGLTVGAVVVLNGGPESGQGVNVLGATQDRPGEVQVAAGTQVAGAQLTKPKQDTTAPTIGVSFPQRNRTYAAGGWNNTCSPAGICGTASDPSGVSRVDVAVRESASGRYWDATGHAFSSNAVVFNQADGTTAWRLALPLPADGAYNLLVQATDGVGNTTPASKRVSVGFAVDTTAPPAPVISSQPDGVTFDTSADFRFTDSEQAVSCRCQLDGAAAACSASPTFSHLAETDHGLQVWAVDAAGNQSNPTSFSWTVALKKSFGISGDASQLLYPGTSAALDVTVANPYNFAIRVLDVSVSATGPSACRAADNLITTGSSFTGPVVVPAHSSHTLSDLGVPAAQRPHVELRDGNANQDPCKNAKFTLTYSGTGTKS